MLLRIGGPAVATAGAAALIAAMLIVGAILLADGLIMMVLHGIGFVIIRVIGIAVPAFSAAKQHSRVLNQIWRELSARQKPAAAAAPPPLPSEATPPPREALPFVVCPHATAACLAVASGEGGS